MSNEPVSQYKAITNTKIEPTVVSYTHPVKELTDEEIEEIGKQYLSAHAQFIGAGECNYEGEIEFARAILKKARE